MPKYIDADKLIELATHEGAYGYVDVHDILQTPTADVVEVVRCKDCMWYEIYELKKDGTDDRRYNPSFCTRYDRLHDPDWFCGDGIRR